MNKELDKAKKGCSVLIRNKKNNVVKCLSFDSVSCCDGGLRTQATIGVKSCEMKVSKVSK